MAAESAAAPEWLPSSSSASTTCRIEAPNPPSSVGTGRRR